MVCPFKTRETARRRTLGFEGGRKVRERVGLRGATGMVKLKVDELDSESTTDIPPPAGTPLAVGGRNSDTPPPPNATTSAPADPRRTIVAMPLGVVVCDEDTMPVVPHVPGVLHCTVGGLADMDRDTMVSTTPL